MNEIGQWSDLDACLEVSESCLREIFTPEKLSNMTIELSVHQGTKIYG